MGEPPLSSSHILFVFFSLQLLCYTVAVNEKELCNLAGNSARIGDWDNAIPLLEQCSLMSNNHQFGWNTGVAYKIGYNDIDSSLGWMAWALLHDDPISCGNAYVQGFINLAEASSQIYPHVGNNNNNNNNNDADDDDTTPHLLTTDTISLHFSSLLIVEMALSNKLNFLMNNSSKHGDGFIPEDIKQIINHKTIRELFIHLEKKRNKSLLITLASCFKGNFKLLTELLVGYLKLYREPNQFQRKGDEEEGSVSKFHQIIKEHSVPFHQIINMKNCPLDLAGEGLFALILEIIVSTTVVNNNNHGNDVNDDGANLTKSFQSIQQETIENELIWASLDELIENLFTIGKIDFGTHVEYLFNQIKLPHVPLSTHIKRLLLSLTAGLDAHLLRLVRASIQYESKMIAATATTKDNSGDTVNRVKVGNSGGSVQGNVSNTRRFKPFPLACPVKCGYITPTSHYSSLTLVDDQETSSSPPSSSSSLDILEGLEVSANQVNQVLICCLQSQQIIKYLMDGARDHKLRSIHTYGIGIDDIVDDDDDDDGSKIINEDLHDDEPENPYEYFAVNKKNKKGWTPLILSSLRNNVYFFNELITRGAEVDQFNHQKLHFLHAAASRNSISILQNAQFAIHNDQFLNLKSNYGLTPYDIACEHGVSSDRKEGNRGGGGRSLYAHTIGLLKGRKHGVCSPSFLLDASVTKKVNVHNKENGVDGVNDDVNGGNDDGGNDNPINGAKYSNQVKRAQDTCDFEVIDGRLLTYEMFINKHVSSSLPLLIKHGFINDTMSHTTTATGNDSHYLNGTISNDKTDGSSILEGEEKPISKKDRERKEEEEEEEEDHLGWFSSKRWRMRDLIKNFGDMEVEVGYIPYSSSFGLHSQRMKLKHFITKYMHPKQTRPHAVSLLDPSIPSSISSTFLHKSFCIFESLKLNDVRNNAITKGFQIHKTSAFYPIVKDALKGGTNDEGDEEDEDEKVVGSKVQFYLGPIHSGAPMHFHKSALNFLIDGKKKWYLVNPYDAYYSNIHPVDIINNHDAKGRTYEEVEVNTNKPDHFTETSSSSSPYASAIECTQESGDILFIPDMWGHAVLNEENSVGFALEFETGVSDLY